MGITVKVVPHQGRTAIAVDGQVIPGMSYFTYMLHSGEFKRNVLQEMVESGTKIYFALWQTWRPRNRAVPWAEDGALDLAPLDEYMAAIANFSADVWFIPRLYFSTPDWWARRYPRELTRYADGEITANQVNGEDDLGMASMASRQWRDDCAAVLRRIIRHVEDGPYGDRVLGYMINSAGTEEWVYWGAQQGRLPDYSPVAQEAFRQWLREKYGDEGTLANAWNTPGLTFADVQAPSEAERRRCNPLQVRDPQVDRPSIDFEIFLSDLCADNLLEWCRAAKEETGGNRLTGAFYGYLLWQSGFASSVVNNGHLALQKLLKAPEIDFVTGITSYDNRELGGPGSFMLPVESVQAAGKLVLNEVDVRTHLTYGSQHNPGDTKVPSNAADSVAVYRREFAHHLIHGAAWWNFDMGGGWYSCPEMQEDFRRQSAIAQDALAWDMSSVSEVAGIISGEGLAYGRFYTMQDALIQREWADLHCDHCTAPLYSAGAPIDWLMTDDLGREAMKRYRVLYLYTPAYLSEQQRRWLDALKGDGRTLVFIGHPGLLTDRRRSVEDVESATGIRFRLHETREPLHIDVRDYTHPITQECEAAVTLGTGAVIGPCLEVADPDARVLGVWRQSGLPAFAVKDFGSWRSVFCASPINDSRVFRGLVHHAGCHLWVEPGRICFANRSLLAVHFLNFSQPIRIHLPAPMDVTDLFSGEEVAKNARHFLIQRTRRNVTLLYRLQAK